MYGNSMGELRVYLRERNQETNIFSSQGNQGKNWHVADLVIKPRINFQVIKIVLKKKRDKSYIIGIFYA